MPNIVKDPICGMEVNLDNAKWKRTHNEITYGFCSESCLKKFSSAPESFVKSAAAATKSCCGGHTSDKTPAGERDLSPEMANVEFTCPMHPEVRQIGPGACPKCGMALEPSGLPQLSDDDPELLDMQRRFAIAAPLSIIVVLLAMTPLGKLLGVGSDLNMVIQGVLTTLIVIWPGGVLMLRAYQSVQNKSPNMFTLIGIGVLAAVCFSWAIYIMPAFQAVFSSSASDHPPVYFEAAAVITALVLLGQVLELTARRKTSEAIRSLMKLQPNTARLVKDNGDEIDVPLESIVSGNRLRILPGASIPVDGRTADGRSFVDESMISGEAYPIEKKSGSALLAGTINGNGSLIMIAEKVGAETVLSRIIHLVADAQRSRAPVQNLADKISAWFVPAVVVIAVVTFAIWFFFGPEPQLLLALGNAIAVLIIACPCALGLATPMSVVVASGHGARHGVLIRNAEALQKLAAIDVVCVDKTGTLTEGHPDVQSVQVFNGISEENAIAIAASLEKTSEHPIANAIVNFAKNKEIKTQPVSEFTAVTGKGVEASIEGRIYKIGSPKWMHEIIPSWEQPAPAPGSTQIYLADEKSVLAEFSVRDKLREDAGDTVNQIKKLNIEIILLTGDVQSVAQPVAEELGIAQVHASLLPEDKHKIIKQLQASGRQVLMAGDGINDAPALAAAEVGIAMGSGTDIAISTAGVTLLHGELHGILKALKLGRGAMRNIHQNLWFAFGYNFLGVPIAAGILYPLTQSLLSPMIAGAAMTLSSVSVIGNSLRINALKLAK